MPEGPMEHFLRSSHFSGGNAAYIEDLLTSTCTIAMASLKSGAVSSIRFLAVAPMRPRTSLTQP